MYKEKLKTKTYQTNVGVDDPVRPYYKGMTRTNVGAGPVSAQYHRGITLIALIITIVVLLILAGVTINLAVDSGELFSKANQAGKEWNQSVEEESSAIGSLLGELDKVSPMAVEISTTLPTGWDTNKIQAVATSANRTAPIPKGYTVSEISGENTIGGGLVIYEIPTGTTVNWANNQITISGTTSNLQETVNQYVWIPVDDINDMVMCKKNGDIGTDGKKVCDLKFEDEELICLVHGLTTEIEITKDNIDSTGLAGRLYAVQSNTNSTKSPYIYKSNITFGNDVKSNQSYKANTGNREPAIVTGNDSGTGTRYDGVDSYLTNIGFSATETETVQQVFKKQLQKDFHTMAKSVAKYGGFYVSRYEIGEKGSSKKNQKVLVAGSNTNNILEVNSDSYITSNMWYGLYNTLKNHTEENDMVKSNMIWR